MPYQRIPTSLRPLYLKGLPSSAAKRQTAHLNLIKAYTNSNYVLENATRLHLIFKAHNSYGHQGAKLFWKNNLKTIQYHNPDLPIEVTRIDCATKEEQLKCPALLKVTLNDGSVKEIDCKNTFNNDIMTKLLEQVDAKLVSLD